MDWGSTPVAPQEVTSGCLEYLLHVSSHCDEPAYPESNVSQPALHDTDLSKCGGGALHHGAEGTDINTHKPAMIALHNILFMFRLHWPHVIFSCAKGTASPQTRQAAP